MNIYDGLSIYQKMFLENPLDKLEKILFQNLQNSLMEIEDPQSALGCLHKCFEAYKNHSKGKINEEVDHFLYDCEHKSLHEIKQKYFENSTAFQTNLIKHCVTLIPLFQKALSNESSQIIKIIEKQFPWQAIRRHEMLRLLIHINQMKRCFYNNSTFECHVIDIQELEAYLNILSQKSFGNKPSRLQLIVCNDVHYTAVDLELSDSKKVCCILDAYQEEKALLIEKAFLEAGFIVFPIGDKVKLQLDTCSCSIFSLSHSMSSAKDSRFLERLSYSVSPLKEKLNPRGWEFVPPSLIKIGQNPDLLESYLNRHQSLIWKEKLLCDYIKLKNRGINGEAEAIDRKLKKYVDKVTQLFKEKTTEEVTVIACRSPLKAIKELSFPICPCSSNQNS